MTKIRTTRIVISTKGLACGRLVWLECPQDSKVPSQPQILYRMSGYQELCQHEVLSGGGKGLQLRIHEWQIKRIKTGSHFKEKVIPPRLCGSRLQDPISFLHCRRLCPSDTLSTPRAKALDPQPQFDTQSMHVT